MKRVTAIFLYLTIALSAYASDSLKVFYRIRLDRDIDKSAQRMVVEGLDRAAKAQADYICWTLIHTAAPWMPQTASDLRFCAVRLRYWLMSTCRRPLPVP